MYMLFINYKLSCACLIVFSIPISVCIALELTSKETAYTLDKVQLAGLWSNTAASMNSAFNCLIFYWKNKVLRAEGTKIIKSMKIPRSVQSGCICPQQSNINAI